MPTIDHTVVIEMIALPLVTVLCAYAGGRAHQWYKHSMDRDQSFREGYSHGYRSLFAVAVQNTRTAAELPNAIGQGDHDNHGLGLHRD